jgi:hypothetical protein
MSSLPVGVNKSWFAACVRARSALQSASASESTPATSGAATSKFLRKHLGRAFPTSRSVVGRGENIMKRPRALAERGMEANHHKASRGKRWYGPKED